MIFLVLLGSWALYWLAGGVSTWSLFKGTGINKPIV